LERRILGKSGIEVTRLCLGVLPVGPLQLDLPPAQGARVVREALERGINFLDTAEMYRTYTHMEPALEGYRGRVVIASKSTAQTYDGMRKAIEDALRALRLDTVDIFCLHAARSSPSVFSERTGAVECLAKAKEEGLIRAMGITTHSVLTVRAAARLPGIDVIFPMVNLTGFGILDGTRDDMVQAIDDAHRAGKGLYGMKALAGGNYVKRLEEGFSFVMGIPGLASVAVGMSSPAEVRVNVAIFEGRPIPDDPEYSIKEKRLFIFPLICVGCGTCVEVCHNGALSLQGDKVVVDPDLCVLCGYCAPHCKEMAIRVI
jgi:aryl-alcohol dehydrogenase-like predicted oxidoreductase